MKNENLVLAPEALRGPLGTGFCSSPLPTSRIYSASRRFAAVQCGAVSGPDEGFASLDQLVVHYIASRRPLRIRVRHAWQSLPSPVALVRIAYGRDPEGVKHRHQHRLTEEALLAAVRLVLLHSDKLLAGDFEPNLEIVRAIQSQVPGVGFLWSYDCAERLGAHLRRGPVDFVYVQRGALQGARALGLRVVSGRIRHSELPEVLRDLEASDVEDFLCSYKSHF
jgi:hypothetical protein